MSLFCTKTPTGSSFQGRSSAPLISTNSRLQDKAPREMALAARCSLDPGGRIRTAGSVTWTMITRTAARERTRSSQIRRPAPSAPVPPDTAGLTVKVLDRGLVKLGEVLKKGNSEG